MSTYAIAAPGATSTFADSERRAAERTVATVGVEYALGEESGRALTADLSETGLFLLTDRAPSVGETVRLTLHLTAHTTLRVLGTVARAVTDGPLRGIGVTFAGMLRAGAETLREFLAKRRERAEAERPSRYVAPQPSFEMTWIPASPEERIPRSMRRTPAQPIPSEATPMAGTPSVVEKLTKHGLVVALIAIPLLALAYLGGQLGGVLDGLAP
jgi:Tfp pilus assembly protein PilZ